jgi:hypothetical protein
MGTPVAFPLTPLQQVIKQGLNLSTYNLDPVKHRAITSALQSHLCRLGLLDPIIGGSNDQAFGPIALYDGHIGQNTRNAVFEFCRMAGISYNREGDLSLNILNALVAAQPDTFLPIQFDEQPNDDISTALARRILRFMRDKGYWIARSPNMFNIVYVEGVNFDGSLNPDTHNQWNDRRIVIRIAPGGQPQMVINHDATTEPGTPSPSEEHPLGVARIAFGQYKSWQEGLHKGRQLALVQTGPVRIFRDKNKDHFRNGDKVYVGKFGINQHSTNNIPTQIGDYSVGCLVGRFYHEHLAFLTTVKQDVRFMLNTNYEFISTVIWGQSLQD